MKDIFVNVDMMGNLDFVSENGHMFCYCCGVTIYMTDEESETERFGRSFCSEKCRKIYYGGMDK